MCKGWHSCNLYRDVDLQKESETFIIKYVQQKPTYCSKKTHTPISLTPFVDDQGILRVGGRTVKTKHILGTNVTNLIILPKRNHASILTIRHYHEAV